AVAVRVRQVRLIVYKLVRVRAVVRPVGEAVLVLIGAGVTGGADVRAAGTKHGREGVADVGQAVAVGVVRRIKGARVPGAVGVSEADVQLVLDAIAVGVTHAGCVGSGLVGTSIWVNKGLPAGVGGAGPS